MHYSSGRQAIDTGSQKTTPRFLLLQKRQKEETDIDPMIGRIERQKLRCMTPVTVSYVVMRRKKFFCGRRSIFLGD